RAAAGERSGQRRLRDEPDRRSRSRAAPLLPPVCQRRAEGVDGRLLGEASARFQRPIGAASDDPPTMRQSALIIAVPEAEPLFSAVREQHDPAAKMGVPAHVTVLLPFMPADTVDEQSL